MLNEHIADDEYLYRGVVQANWDEVENRPSSAAFKDSNGVSVDRQGDRANDTVDADVINNFKARGFAFKAIIKVKTEKVRAVGAIALYKPVADNIYHSEIHDGSEKITLTQGKAKKLREESEQIYP